MKNRLNLQTLKVAAVTLSLALFTFGFVTAAAQECPAGQHSTPQGCIGPPTAVGAVVTGKCAGIEGQRQYIGYMSGTVSPTLGFITNSASSNCGVFLECLSSYTQVRTYAIIAPGQTLVLFGCGGIGGSDSWMGTQGEGYQGTYRISIGAIG